MSTSGTVAPSRRPTATDDNGTKPSKPDFYYGERNKLNHWLLQLDLYFKLTKPKVDEKDRVSLAATFMRGKALSWINTNLQKYLDDEADKEVDEWMEDFSKFKVEIRRYFGPANEASEAEGVIQRLKQLKSAADYAVTFQHFAAKTSWNDDAQMSMFRRGLKYNVQEELMRYNGKIEDLDDLITAAVDCDDKLHELSMGRNYGSGGGGFTGRAAWGNRGNQGRRDTWAQRGDPMEIDVLERRSSGANGNSPRKCYSCGKPGHIARNCRQKNKVHREQLNVLETFHPTQDGNKVDSDSDESWDNVSNQSDNDTFMGSAETPILKDKGKQKTIPKNDNPNPKEPGDNWLSWENEPYGNIKPRESAKEASEGAKYLANLINRANGELTDAQREYPMDIRNLQHANLHWSFCYSEYCDIHESSKDISGWQPRVPRRLKCSHTTHNTCINDKCATHLIDKRKDEFFPGHTEEWNEHFLFTLRYDSEYCMQENIQTYDPEDKPLWQRCLRASCSQHRLDKIRFGVLSNKYATVNSCQEDTRPDYNKYFILLLTVRGREARALLDTGAARNFISSHFVKKAGIQTISKRHPYELKGATGTTVATRGVNKETVPTKIAMQQHNDTLTFDILELATHDFILGMNWLQKHNPTVYWRTKQLRFKDGLIVKAWRPGKSRDGATDEKTYEQCSGMHYLEASEQGRQNQPPARVTEETSPAQQTTSTERNDKALVPYEYRTWKHLFDDDKTTGALPKHQPWDHKIPLMEGKQPTFGPIYQLSQKELEELDRYIKENLAKGFIRPSESPAGYPILFVPKKNGKLRLCVDYRKLNGITIKNRYPLPNANELRDRLHGAQWFTKLDMRGAYNLIRMAEGEEWKTAFRTRYGSYEYLVMPFGLTNAPASCQELVNRVLRDLLDKSVIAYLDDILVFSKTMEQHKQDVIGVLTRLAKVNLRLEPEKCEFHKKEVEFLGYVVTTEGIKADPNKVRALLEWPRPENVKQLQSFLGTINFNRKFIKGFSQLALPLTELTKKDNDYKWTDVHERAFAKLKEACTTLPVLRTFEPGKPIRIETDASDTATGACLRQQHEGNWHPVAYYSRKMTPAEQNYDIHDKELLAIVLAFEQWRVYAEGATDVEVLTDHKNLIYFTTTKVLNRRQTRWSELLGQYKFRINHTPGKDNATADGLSRRQDLYQEKADNQRAILSQTKDGLGPVQYLNNLVMEPVKDFLSKIQEACKDDYYAQQMIKNGKTTPIKYNDCYYVPEVLLEELIRDYHDNPKYGHPGVTRTLDLITRNWSSPRMRTSIENYIRNCPACNQNKAANHAKYGYLQKIRLPEFPWQSLTMDFIVKLPPSMEPSTKEIYNAIMVVVDRHTKYMTFIPFNETYNAVQLGYIFLDKVVRIRGFPTEIISDRDKLFTSAYWKTLNGQMGVKLKLSTAYHPQTDGQTERANRTLKQYLRNYISWNQSDWVEKLPIAEVAVNNLVSRATGTTPFFANYGRHPNLMDTPKPNPRAQQAIMFVDQLEQTHRQITMSLEKAQGDMERNENKHRKEGPQLKEGMKVWLSTTNLKPKRPNKSLDHKRIGPFKIEKVVGPVNYKLELPPDAKIHPVFHVSLLEKASDNTPVATEFKYEPEEESVYEVEKILDYKDDKYLIKWVNYPDSENTWEPETNLLPNCAGLLRDWRRQHQQRQGTRSTQPPAHRIRRKPNLALTIPRDYREPDDY